MSRLWMVSDKAVEESVSVGDILFGVFTLVCVVVLLVLCCEWIVFRDKGLLIPFLKKKLGWR